MGRRSRKPRHSGALARGYARSEERNEAVRRQLEPLAPGERPGAVTVAAILAVLLALANLLLLALDVEVQGEQPATSGVLIFAAIMLATAAGMWRAKYWAVLGFQALLALSIIIASLRLLTASNVWAVVVPLSIVLLGGWLFWKLVRALARLQMPAR
jgi:hypothetical protein